jgi:hypothetical protein
MSSYSHAGKRGSEPPIYDPTALTATEALADWTAMAKGAFATNTLGAWKADWEIFSQFCQAVRHASLPAAPETVRDFDSLANEKKPATIRRYVATIGRAHGAATVPDPTTTESVKLALKEMSRTVPARQKQARGLIWAEIAQILNRTATQLTRPSRSRTCRRRLRHPVPPRRISDAANRRHRRIQRRLRRNPHPPVKDRYNRGGRRRLLVRAHPAATPRLVASLHAHAKPALRESDRTQRNRQHRNPADA